MLALQKESTLCYTSRTTITHNQITHPRTCLKLSFFQLSRITSVFQVVANKSHTPPVCNAIGISISRIFARESAAVSCHHQFCSPRRRLFPEVEGTSLSKKKKKSELHCARMLPKEDTWSWGRVRCWSFEKVSRLSWKDSSGAARYLGQGWKNSRRIIERWVCFAIKQLTAPANLP